MSNKDHILTKDLLGRMETIRIDETRDKSKYIKLPIHSYWDLSLTKQYLLKSILYMTRNLNDIPTKEQDITDYMLSINQITKILISIEEEMIGEYEVIDKLKGWESF